MSGSREETSGQGKSPADITLKTIDLRLASVREAIQRTRFVFVVMTIASSAILFTLWNDRFSRDKDLAFESPSYSNTEVKEGRPEPLHVYGRQQLVAEWYKNRIIQIGLLGIRLSVSDLSLIGSFTLVVITLWFYYSQRRENNALVALLRDVHGTYRPRGDLEVREMVYQGVKQSLVFIRTEETDEPLDGLEDARRPSDAVAKGAASPNPKAGEGAGAGEASAVVSDPRPERKTFTDRVLNFLFHLPFWAVVAIIIRDLSALFMKSPTTNVGSPLGVILWNQVRAGTLAELWESAYPIFLVVVFDSFAIACAIYIWVLCNRSRRFADGSKKALRQYEEALRLDRPALG